MSVKQAIILIACIILYYIGFQSAWLIYPYLHQKNSIGVDKKDTISANATISTKTQISYVKKDPGEKTDIDVSVIHPEVSVLVNGHAGSFSKATDESYVFEKNKVVLDQTSKVSIDIKVPDNTRHYGIGAGIGFNGLSVVGTFPVQWVFDGWIYGDRTTGAGGIMLRF